MGRPTTGRYFGKFVILVLLFEAIASVEFVHPELAYLCIVLAIFVLMTHI